MIRRLLAIITGAAVGVAAAMALSTGPAAATAQRSCLDLPECWYDNGNAGVQPGWNQAQWFRNDGGWFIRGGGICGNGTRNTIEETGGWVAALDTPSEMDCTSGYPNLTKAFFDTKKTAGGTITRHWVTIPLRGENR